MEHEQQQEFYCLRELAGLRLRESCWHGGRGERTERLARVLTLPSFGNWCARGLYRCARGDDIRYVGACRTWDQKADLDSLRTPVARLRSGFGRPLTPTLIDSQCDLSPELASPLAEELATLAVEPIVSQPLFGLDGTRFELTIGDTRLGLTFHYWWRPPDEWHQIGSIVERITQLIPQSAGSSGPTPGIC